MTTLKFAVGYLGFDRVVMCFFFGVEIADARTIVNAMFAGHSSRGNQQGIDQTGFAAGAMSAERNVATLADRDCLIYDCAPFIASAAEPICFPGLLRWKRIGSSAVCLASIIFLPTAGRSRSARRRFAQSLRPVR